MFEPQTPPHVASDILRKTYVRPYKKSTKGCNQCKTRKIKCNEERPCGNCKRRFVDSSCCRYGSIGQKDKISPVRSHVTPPRASLQKSLSVTPIGVTSSCQLDLRLMYHYTKSTCNRPLLSSKPSISHSMWEVDIPQIAFSSEIVLNALLGISAFNLLSLNPGDRTLAAAARSYSGKAIVQQRNAVRNINRDNAEPLLLGALLLAHYSWLSSNSGEFEEPNTVDLRTYRMCQGMEALFQEASPWLKKYGSYNMVAIEQEKSPHFDDDFMEMALQDMVNLLSMLDDTYTDPNIKESYHKAADEIIAIYSLIAGGGLEIAALERKIVTFLHRVPHCFVDLLEEKSPMAMALLARNIAQLELLEDKSAWWVHGAGSCSVPVNAIYKLHESMPPAYLWTLEFPLKIVRKEIKVNLKK